LVRTYLQARVVRLVDLRAQVSWAAA
jgi:hypothetical protein